MGKMKVFAEELPSDPPSRERVINAIAELAETDGPADWCWRPCCIDWSVAAPRRREEERKDGR